MRKIICDKCGKEIDRDWFFYSEIEIPDIDTFTHFGTICNTKYDICYSCSKKIENWLKTDKEKPEDERPLPDEEEKDENS